MDAPPENMVLDMLTDLLTPLFVRLTGANLNRRTLDNIRAAGLKMESLEKLAIAGMFKFVVARPSQPVCERRAGILACLTDLKVPSHLTSLKYSDIAYSLHATWRGTQSF